MPFFRIDDHWWSHPKIAALTPAARDLWVRAGSYSMQHLTDGLVSHAALKLLGAKPKQVAELVDGGLWTPVLPGYQFHDWSHYQVTAEQAKADRDGARERMRELRANRRRNTDGSSPPVRPNTSVTGGERSDDVRNPVPVPVPTTPVESKQSSPETSRDTGTDRSAQPLIEDSEYAARASRLRVDFAKVAACLRRQAQEPVPAEIVWTIVWRILSRAEDRRGDRTGLVITSLRDDWAEWTRVVYPGASA